MGGRRRRRGGRPGSSLKSDWSSDGDDNHGSERGTDEAKPVPPLNSATAPLNEDWGSDSDEIIDLDWDVHEAVPSRELATCISTYFHCYVRRSEIFLLVMLFSYLH
ncbi:uncharacterized protein LOC109822397 [Asparagus officinalis]|uniref:uncharacterized protein LOC109822397 n=1 Tax=Asparagus officinalis TaxID=4686 RepID=UPI00098E6A1F|nr:uncharacterized protein LOC109822397 [Asparagus officinalis]